MAGTINNLVKSDAAWMRYQEKAKNRAFGNRTDAKVRSGAERRRFASARDAAMAERAENDE